MNWQNINRDDPTIKHAVLPKGDLLMEFDYSQIEPRMLAYFSAKLGDTTLVDIYASGADIYLTTAGAMLNKPPEKVTKDERQVWGKKGFLEIIYGAGPKLLAGVHDIPLAQAKEFYANTHKNLPCIRMISNPPPRFHRDDYVPGAIERVLDRKGYIETIAGRRLRPGKWEAHKMLNKLIQGSAAEIMKRAIVRCAVWRATEGLRSHPVLTVHDSLLWDVWDDERERLLAHVPQLMCDEPEINEVIQLVVEAKTGPRWSEMEDA